MCVDVSQKSFTVVKRECYFFDETQFGMTRDEPSVAVRFCCGAATWGAESRSTQMQYLIQTSAALALNFNVSRTILEPVAVAIHRLNWP